MTTTVTYSSEQSRVMDASMSRLVGSMNGKDVNGIVINMLMMIAVSLQRKNPNSYTYANLILSNLSSPSPPSVNLTPSYVSESELNNVLDKAFQETETSPSLTPRDRVLLRMFFFGAGIIIAFTNIIKTGSFSSDISFNFDSEGKPATYQSVTDAFPNKTTQDILSVGCDIIVDMFNTIIETKDNPDSFNLIKMSAINSFNSRMGTSYKSDGTDDLTLMINTMNIGPTYIMWLATQKWKIDWNWTGA